MILRNGIVDVLDVSGLKTVKAIGFIRNKKNYASFLDVIVGSVKTLNTGLIYKKGDIVYGLVVKTKFPFVRFDGSVWKSTKTGIILVNKTCEPQFFQFSTFFFMEIRVFGFYKMSSLAVFLV